ncbi:Mce family protein [Gordonia araii NBRC 100433]|uniref:Mce family protein n=1 Tax=Gordonia araii NBRC 100433 TaxID=1073574 RepID=G7H7F8_9ACTN|nr:hypothetical protein [Gordonia araii]NNG98466.1 hypothetical protein [Gordonia araii NBRC 100433]GAB11783.1 Mce family protein [Gordonia araii NBRC 100433]
MPDFRAPGMAADRGTYLSRAVFAIIGAVVVTIAAVAISTALPDDALRIRMHTDTLAGGIEEGTGVVVNGSEIGLVRSVAANNGGYVLDLELDKNRLTDPGILTTTTRLSYAPKNLFGISAVVLNSEPGGDPIASGGEFFPDTPVDATLTALLRQLSDMQDKAFDPYVSDLLAKADRASMAFMPVLEILGRLTGLVVETESIPAEVSLPQLTGLVGGLPDSLRQILPSVNKVLDWPEARKGGTEYLERMRKGFDHATNTTMGSLGRLLGPAAVGQLMPLMKDVLPLLERILESSPNARKNGLQIRQLIYNLDRALPKVGGRPVLKVDVVLRGMPGPVAGLTGGVR